jgi:HEAT repeat protein
MNTPTDPGNTLESLMETLGHKDGLLRENARNSLVALGAPAVLPLVQALQGSHSAQVRWEAAKALGEISDDRAIPALIAVLYDRDSDVVWLAAVGLNGFGKRAWPALLQELVDKGTESVTLRKELHHVFHNQQEAGYEDLLAALMTALEQDALPETAPMVAHKILTRVREKS